jgi:hypothetical protein
MQTFKFNKLFINTLLESNFLVGKNLFSSRYLFSDYYLIFILVLLDFEN